MSTADLVKEYEAEARQIPGLPTRIVYLADNPQVTSGLRAFFENGTGFIEGAPGQTVTRRMALHELGHLHDFNDRSMRDAFWTWRFGSCTTAPRTWAQAKADSDNPYKWHVDPGESIAECFAVAIEGSGKERTLDYGCTIDPAGARTFFGFLPTSPTPPNDRVIEWQGPLPTSNFSQGRSGNPITVIVDHWMATTFNGAIAHFMNGGAQVSAHYLISQTGRIVQLVRDEDTAFHAGNWTVNQLSIGIEHEGGPNLPPMTDALYAASAWLHHKLSLDYGIRLVVGESVKPHRSITPTQCPGTLDLDRIVAEAGGEDLDRATFNQWFKEEYLATIDPTIRAMKDAYNPLVPLAHPKSHKHDSVVDLAPTIVTTGEPK